MSDPGLVSILIVTWNRREDLDRSIRSALGQVYSPVEVVVFDNGSTDATGTLGILSDPRVRYHRSDENLGCISGRNAGIPLCRGEFIYQLDDDGRLARDAVERAVECMRDDGRIGVVMSRLVLVPQGEDPVDTPSSPSEGRRYHATFSGGRSMLRSAMCASVGLYPEGFWRQGEEQDLALRMMAAGWLCVSEPRSVMYHRKSPVGRDQSAFTYYTLRNTNRSAIRLWPLESCCGRVLLSVGRALVSSWRFRRPALFFAVVADVIGFLLHSRRERRPVSRRVLREFRRLCHWPSKEPPDLPDRGRV